MTRTIACFLLVACVLIPEATFAQKDENESFGIFDNRQQYYQFMGDLKTQGQGDPELMAMVPMINDMVLNKPIGSTGREYSATSSTLGLLDDPEVRKELEMVDDQYDEFLAAREEIQKRAQEQLREIDFSDFQNAKSRILAIRDAADKDLQDNLLPQQMQRLRQILAQTQLRFRTLIEVITSEPMKTKLEITDDQSDELKAAEREIEKEMEREIAKIRKKGREKLLSRLKSKQKKQVEEMFGDAFEFDSIKKERGTKKKYKK